MSGQVGTEPLVLLPGLSTDARLFRDQITVLSRRFPVMVGAPVQGERVEEIASALLGMLPARSALFGYGFGGVVALELMRRAPERFTRIALMATTPLAGTPHEAAELETRIVAARTGRLADAISSEYPVASLGSGIGRARVTDVI